ncbi:MAG: L,D-transpeptidase family protein [Firmicutes bacterium]|nr:L,D-transpeptidase family protein [Bacillota bacterium]
MRGRLLLLLLLSLLLFALSALPEGTIPAAAASEYLIWIDLSSMSLTLYQNQRQVKRWPIASGANDTPTPLGVYRVNRRFMPEGNRFGTRFLGLSVPWGIYAIHGTNQPGSIGSHASHGCIRMFNRDVEQLYSLVPNWTRVVIENGPYGALGMSLPTLRPDSRGSQVLSAQQRLMALGYYNGGLDGIYGPGMSAALKRFKEEHGMPWEDVIDGATWEAMGVMLFE